MIGEEGGGEGEQVLPLQEDGDGGLKNVFSHTKGADIKGFEVLFACGTRNFSNPEL